MRESFWIIVVILALAAAVMLDNDGHGAETISRVSGAR